MPIEFNGYFLKILADKFSVVLFRDLVSELLVIVSIISIYKFSLVAENCENVYAESVRFHVRVYFTDLFTGNVVTASCLLDVFCHPLVPSKLTSRSWHQ